MTHPGRAASALGSTGHANHDHTSRRKLPVRSGGVRPAAAALASGRRPGIPESGSGTTAADGGPPGPAPTQPGCWPRSAGSVTLASPGLSPPWTPGARSTPASTAPKPPTWFTPCCPRTCTGSSPSSGAGPPLRALDRPHPKHTPAHRPPTASKPRQGRRTRQPRVRSDQTHPLTERRTGGQNDLSVRPHRHACRPQRACIAAATRAPAIERLTTLCDQCPTQG